MLAAAPAVMIANVRFGSKADICSAKGHVRSTPKSGRIGLSAALLSVRGFVRRRHRLRDQLGDLTCAADTECRQTVVEHTVSGCIVYGGADDGCDLIRSMLWRGFSGRVRAYSAARAGRDRAAHARIVPRPGMRIADVFRSVSSPHHESCHSSSLISNQSHLNGLCPGD